MAISLSDLGLCSLSIHMLYSVTGQSLYCVSFSQYNFVARKSSVGMMDLHINVRIFLVLAPA